MTRTSVALFAALEAVIVAAVGLGICLVPFTLLWAVQFHLGADFLVVWRAAADVWLVGHGVNLTVQLDEQTVAVLGLPGAATPFQITIAVLGFAVLTAALGVRTGLRAAETPHRVAGAVGALVPFLVISALVTSTAASPIVQPSIWQGILLPPFVYALGISLGFVFIALRSSHAMTEPAGTGEFRAGELGTTDFDTAKLNTNEVNTSSTDSADVEASGSRDRIPPRTAPVDSHGRTPGTNRGSARFVSLLAPLRAGLVMLPTPLRVAVHGALRAGSAAAALVIAGAAFILALLIFGNYGSIISLYEQLQTGVVGGIALTVGQLAFLPNLVIWMASWLIGPGFAIGAGSSVNPIGTALGPLPGLPLFGVIPSHGFSFGLVGIVVPLVAGFLAGALLRGTRRTVTDGPIALFLTALGIGIVAGIELGLLAWWSSGALGPGRLHDVGPNPWLVGAIATAEVAIAAVIGLMAGGRARR